MNFDVKNFYNKDYKKIVINNYRPLINFNDKELNEIKNFNDNIFDIKYDNYNECIVIRKNISQEEKFLGLGEKAFDILKNRHVFTMYNSDLGGYKRHDDPLYVSIPFIISVSKYITGILINSTSRIDIDIGIEEYDKLTLKIYDISCEIYIFDSSNFDDLYKKYSDLTGKTFMPPLWAIGHQISRYSYYPENEVYNVIDKYREYVNVSAVYLDIDYMDKFKIFTFDKNKFPDNERLLNEIHKRNVKLVTILDPGVKFDQNYDVFKNGLGNYVINKNDEIYTSKLWPGNCAMPDFFNEKAYNWWKSEIKNFIKNADGLWLDMNEPSLFNEFKTIDPEALHSVNNNIIEHKYLHNAYSYFEVKATYDAINEEGKEPFIVSRSGYTGIQKYAAIWTGDNKSSDDDLKLQISMVTSLNLSGISICGCDLGGFAGHSSPELIAKYYKMALLFPFYRNHKDKYANDQEIFNLPSIYRNDIIKSVNLRYELIEYIYSIIYESHLTGIPVIRPLFYYNYIDVDSYYINDEYMLGRLLYAPQIYDNSRKIYLQPGKWLDIENMVECNGGYIESSLKFPLYLMENSMLVINGKIIVYGKSEFILFKNRREIKLSFDGSSFKSSEPLDYELILFNINKHNITIDNKIKINSNEKNINIRLNNNKILKFE